jgi:L-amino acid N-acyltransferase YncA
MTAQPERGTTAKRDGGDGSTAVLRDGVAATLRPLSPTDVDSVVRIADTLSDRERYLRFFSVHPGYLAEWAESLTTPTPGVVAMGAWVNGNLVGVANYSPSTQADEAEIAVVVAHDQHDRGVGSALLAELVRIARRNGERHLVADVLCENNDMLHLIRDSHVPITMHRDGPEISVDLDLHALGDG